MPSTIDIKTPEAETKPVMTRKETMLENLGSFLEQKFAKYSADRQFKEDEWTAAIRQHDGKWSSDDRTKIQQALWASDADNPPPPVNITRPKTNIAIARMQDSQFPVGGDYNFILSPSPVPELLHTAKSVTDPTADMQAEAAAAGVAPEQVPTPREVAEDLQTEAMSAAAIMQAQIEDDLTATGYGQKARLAIEDLAILGTAVIKGPVLTPHIKRVYHPEVTSSGETIQVLGSAVEYKADVFRVDPRLVYPDPAARMPDEIEDIFELHIMTRTELAGLADSPSFMRGQIAKAIEQGMTSSDLPSSISDTAYLTSGVVTDNRFIVKEYHGPIDKQALLDGELITPEDAEDPLAMFFGEVWLCNGIIIRMSMSYLEGVSAIPYGLASWERDPGSVFGHGVPFLLSNPQHVVNNAYLLLLDNASLTSGPQIVLNKEMIEPAAKETGYDIAPMKVWFLTEYGADVREAMQFVNVPAQMDGIANIMDMAMQFSDLESSTPLIQQGDIPVGNNTLTGVGKVMSASNINQKRASMNWDDYITKPLATRMYHHQMQYGTNQAAKGDLEVKIGGATERIDAEIRAQELERLLGLASSNPDFQMQIDPKRAFRQLAVLTRAGNILRTPEEVMAEEAKLQEQAAQAAQQDPAALTAQANMLTAQTKAQTAQMEQQVEAQRLQLEQFKAQTDARQQELRAEAEARKAFVDMQIQEAEREMSLIRLASEREVSVQQLRKDLAIADRVNEVAMARISADLNKFNTEIAVKMQTGEGI